MIHKFKADFWSIARENKGYYAWARQSGEQLYRVFSHHYPFIYNANTMGVVQRLLNDGLGLHPLLDIAFEAFARAEVRLGLRFILQRSHEERLTGHLISELDAAIQVASDSFSAAAAERYSEPLEIDFVYSDLSRGGKFEKITGGDFGLILVIDLPDRPRVIRYAAIQAKRLEKSSSLEKYQFDTITKNFGDAAAYLFYDCEFRTLAPPIMISPEHLKYKREEKKDTKSFSVDQEYVFERRLPLSLWLLTELGAANTGTSASDFQSAYSQFTKFRHQEEGLAFTRLAMVSIGRKFEVTPDIETGLRIDL